MKRNTALLMILIFVAGFFGCTPPAPAATPSPAVSNAATGTQKTLTIKSLQGYRDLDYAINIFNRAHPDIKIQADNFDTQLRGMKQGGAIDLSALIQELNTEMLSGTGPDIIIVSNLPYYKYTARGMLADIGAMMARDKSFDSSKYYTNIFDACKSGGKLTVIPTSFSFYVLSCRKQYNPGSGNVTMQQFLDKAASLPSNVFAFAKKDPMQIAADYLQDSFCTFVDYDTHTAHFNSPEFIGTIKALKSLIDTKMSGQSPQDGGELEQQMKGTVAYSTQTIRRLTDVCMANSALGQDAVLVNIPTMADSGSYTFSSNTMLAINAASKNMDAAWEFIKTMLSEDVQANGHPDGFPVLMSACRKLLDEQANKDYMLDKAGQRLVVRLGGTELEVKPLGPTGTAFLADRFGKLNRLSVFDDSIIKIITEELPSFFAGEKSAEDTANLIQNRVTTVLTE